MKTLLLKLEKSTLLIILLIGTSISRGQSTQTYTTNGSFITPAGVTTVKAEAYGGGGAGGYGGGSNKNGGGGGGGGGYSVVNTASVIPGTTYTIVVGTPGVATATTTSGNGSATSATFASTSITAIGGAGGRRFSGGATGGLGGNGSMFDGGRGGTGTTAGSGGGGGAAGPSADGGIGSVTAGGTSGGGFAGIGANGTTLNTAVGNVGNNYGAGGSGGTRNSFGGNGAGGYMIITYTCPTYALTSISSPNIFSSGSATITLNSTPTDLPVGDYIVTYSASGSTTISSATYSMTVTTAGIGTIICPSVNVGTTIITINRIESSYCSTDFTSGGPNNTVTITSALPSITLGAQPTICSGVSTSSIPYSGVVNGADEYSIEWNAAGIAAGMTNVGWTALSGGLISLTGLTGTAGTYPMTIRVRNSATGCSNLIVSPSVVCGTGNEGNTVSLSTANGTFASVDFASYGTPNGTCGSFTTGACHASNSLSLVSASAIGQTSFSIAATNGVFGDPCGGTAKRLYIQATSSAFNLVVNSSSTITLSSGAGTNNQTTCTNTSMSTITFNTVAATGATFSGLPAGVTGSWASNVVTISGTPTASGTYPYIVTLTGGCVTTVTASGTITVSPSNTIILTSAAGTNNQSLCSGSAITNITYGTTNATGATFSGLPLGINGNFASNVVTISGTSLATGTFNYTVTLTGGCGTISATGTITINTNNTITLSSGAGTNNQTRCINTVMNAITFTTTSATGASFLGLPAGVSGNWAANVVTISGTPTVSGTFPYSVILTGGCGIVPVTASGTITVTPNNTITLSSAAGTNIQTRCINSAITNIRYNTTTATGATFTGLPAGVTGSWVSNVVTISGTPSVSGTYNYTVTLTGGCGTTTATGTITVTPNNTITLSSGAGTNNQTRCINTALNFITFNTFSATGATFSGLPAGVSGNWATNVVTISGTPTASGTFPYTVTLTGGCGATTTATGTLTVTPNNTITLSSAAGTNIQTRCVNSAITNIRYNTTTATGATFSGLPAGVTGSWASNVVTISGTPTAAGTYNYTVTLTGGCGTTTATGTITVNPILNAGVTISVSPSASICAGSSATFTATPTNGGTTPSYQWRINGGNVTGQTASTFTTTTLNNLDVVTVVMTSNATPCLAGSPVTSSGITMTVSTMPTVTGTTPGSRTGAGTVLLGATASSGTLNWYAASTGGTSLGSGTSFTTPFISTTTTFYVEAVNGGCTTSRTPVVATVNYSEIDVQGNATSIVSGDVTPTTADWTDFGTTNPTRTFTILNTGSSLLTIGAVTISGTNASNFTVTTAPASAVAIGGSTTFVVTFNPSAVGIRTANISIVNNDLDENPYTFDIQGTGVEQEIDIQGNATSIVNGDATPTTADWTDFSSVAGTRTFTISNSGNIALNIGAITIGGANAGDFSVTTLPSATVGAGGTTTFVVTFAPTAINTRNATISIVNNDTTENPYTFAIRGFGVIPEIDIQGNAVSIPDNLTPAPTTANWTDFSSTAGTRTFTIVNNGNIALTIGAITFTGTNASEFTVLTAPASSVAAFSSTTFTVRFLPTALGLRTANISIVNNDSTENPYDFRIQGTGVAREIELEGLGLSIANNDFTTSVNDGTDFGPADINLATVTRTFTIRNTGSLALTISNPTITGANASEFSITANPGTLSILAGSSTTFQVTFNPSAVFTRSARINIVNNDSDENPYIFAIQGTGLLDNDGDGIENNADEDDDNDGVLDSLECGTCVSNPFVNGSFETPVIGASTYSILPTTSVPGWETSAENFIEIWSSGFNGVPSAAGNQFAELNANIAGTLYQSFCLNGAGGTINWAIKHRGRGGVDQAFVKFGSTLANALSSTPIVTMVDGTSSWGSYSGTYTIPAGQTNIVLTFQAGYTGSGSASVGNFIDDVQIIINQNCIDTDIDGVADAFDVDSDNDGIPDIEEAGFKQYSNNTATMDKTNPANWRDTNANGINDYIDAMVTAGTYAVADTDGDGVYNHLDLDSDNDSLFDVDEAGLLNGDGDINGDGKGDGLDSEGDGLLNLYDNSTAFGSAFRPYAQDSDLNGVSDYLQLDANDDGVNDIQTSLYGNFDANGDGRIDGSGDTDADGITDIFDTNDALRGSPRDLDRKLYLDFDGRNDYAEDSAILGGLSNATLMAWIDLNSTFSTTGVVVGQDKFYIRVTSARLLQAVVNGSTIASFGTPLNRSQWCHVAATYGGGNLTLYLNGKSVATVALTGAIAADASKLSLGRNPVSAASYFKGKIDEVRVFNVALTPNQVERMVYQEIQNNASQVRGAVVPKDIGALPFANLLKYYRMDTYKDDIVDNLTTGTVDTGTGMKLYNHKVINYQQAPMPFTTVRTGTFATAINDTTKDIRGLDVLDFDYSIIQVKHNITETANSTDLALFIDPAVTVSMTNDTKLQNDWYLKLDGKIDLVGRSQLVQSATSDLDVTSSGSLERDQQGQSNKFNYNYWSSPVSSINNTTINHGYTVAGVMKDGTDPNSIQNILWTSGVNGSPTIPAMTLSSYWIFKFQNSTNSYANWASAGPNGALLPGQGYTLKGNGSGSENQNYTFVGKPNSGNITSTVGAGNLNLCGNPYPSAIDADKFIDDNITSTTGTLYIWEHYSTNNSHNTIQYQGGYATYTKTGGTAPVAPAGTSGLGASSKTPKRFMPVGQGFFLTGSATGGTINFNNGQRLFVKEDNVSSYTMFRTTNNTVTSTPEMDNTEDTYDEGQFMKLRVGYNSTDNLHRQTLIGFMNENATSGYDNGYDGISIEALTNDMYFINGTNKLNISGEGFFDVNAVYPIGVKNATSGNVTFVVDGKENFDENQEIYIHDNVTNTYNSIKSQNYEVNLPAGTYDNRFTLRFTDGTSLGTVDQEANFGIGVTHSQSNSMINIKNPLQEVTVKSVALFNLLGQKVTEWTIDNQDQANIQLQVANVSTGTYIVKVITDGGNVTKKILVKK
jgi:hypothetical protein